MNVIQVYKGSGLIQPWRWRVVSPNGEIVAQHEGYLTAWNAKRAARRLFPALEVKRTAQ